MCLRRPLTTPQRRAAAWHESRRSKELSRAAESPSLTPDAPQRKSRPAGHAGPPEDAARAPVNLQNRKRARAAQNRSRADPPRKSLHPGKMVKQRVSYFYDTDVGHFYYGPGHPMKPHRIKMAHHLILSTGLYRKLDVYRPHLAAPLEMTRFHSDDYVKFLSKVSPESTRPFLQQMAQFNVGECTDCPARPRRPVVSWCFHFIQTTRVQLTMTWVVSFSMLRPFGAPRRFMKGSLNSSRSRPARR